MQWWRRFLILLFLGLSALVTEANAVGVFFLTILTLMAWVGGATEREEMFEREHVN